MKKFLISGIMLLAVVMILKLPAFAQIKTGGYKSISTDDKRVVEAANFAVDKRSETNSEQEGLTLSSIDKAETQVVAGTNFKLCLTVSLDDESQQVETVVYQNLKQAYSLTSWTVKECGEEGALKKSSGKNPRRRRNANYAPDLRAKLLNCPGNHLSSLKQVESTGAIGGKEYGIHMFTNGSSTPYVLYNYQNFILLNDKRQIMPGIAHAEKSEDDRLQEGIVARAG